MASNLRCARQVLCLRNELAGRYSERTVSTLGDMDTEEVDLKLVERVIEHISRKMDDGAILVFLPGWSEISKLVENLERNVLTRDRSRFLVIPLHSMMPLEGQAPAGQT